jgi:hypothetical protein
MTSNVPLRIAKVFAGVAAIVLSGCGNDDADAAAANLAKWRRLGPASYVYVVQMSCFCVDTQAHRVVVTDGIVTSALDAEGKMHSERTMTELLERTAKDAAAHHDDFDARYDPELGYLKYLAVDQSSSTADDEFSITVSCLSAGTDNASCPL